MDLVARDPGAEWRRGNRRVVRGGADITERRQSEEALRRSEKLAATGRLAATMAHEINNPLEAVTNLIYLAKGTDEHEDALRYLASPKKSWNASRISPSRRSASIAIPRSASSSGLALS